MAIEGADYAWDRPTVDSLVAAKKRFVLRYGGPGSTGKQIDAAEANSLRAVNIAIVANAEGAADGMLGGYSIGASWATSAHRHFTALGMPADRPIYLSADFDVTEEQWPKVRQALQGAASVIGAGRVGVYGGLKVMLWARRDGVAAWFWQTYAWSKGQWAPGNHVEQYLNGVPMGGGTVDLNRALVDDFGQWPIEGDDDMSEYSKPDPWGNDPDGNNRTPAQKQRDMYAVVMFGTKPVGGDGQPVGPAPWLLDQISAIREGVDAIMAALRNGVPIAAQVDLTDAALNEVEERVREVQGDALRGGIDAVSSGDN